MIALFMFKLYNFSTTLKVNRNTSEKSEMDRSNEKQTANDGLNVSEDGEQQTERKRRIDEKRGQTKRQMKIKQE